MGQKNSIRVKSKTEYRIEVNDDGEEIVFDLTDTSLTPRLFKMYEAVEKLSDEYEGKLKELEEQPDEARNTMTEHDFETGVDKERVLITKNQYKGAELLDEFYRASRVALDKFLGIGACQKIFGDKNYLNMFNDLLEQLEPHFKQMGLDAEQIKHTGATKHAPNRAQRRAMK